MIHFVLESQGNVRENEFCKVVGTMWSSSARLRPQWVLIHVCALYHYRFWGLIHGWICADLQIFDKFSASGGSKSSEKLSELLSEADTSPAAQERLKVAFAEGYLASDKKKVEPTTTLPHRLFRVIGIIITVYLGYQLLQAYFALGGSTLSAFFAIVLV